ncbi:MAG: ABC transporter ATP-binding protein/permease [Desulfovibrio sp.]|jgi:ABC-type multidrug transport system fused ATPase/permease subunit|nr:ABC transporter ATP-binding protein/permease [Desulfovibrio sp.]
MTVETSLLQSLRVLLPLVPPKEKRRFVCLLLLAVSAAFVELVLTGLVALLAAVFGSPEAVLRHPVMLRLREHDIFAFAQDPRLLALAMLGAIVLTIAFKNTLAIAQQWHAATFSETVSAAARSHIFRFYQRAPFVWLTHTGVADLGFGLNAAVQLAPCLTIALQIFTGLVTLVTLFIGLVSVSPLSSLLFFIVIGLGGYGIVRFSRALLDRCAAAVYAQDYTTNKIVHLGLHGLKEIRLYRRENSLFSALTAQLAASVRKKRVMQTVARLPVCGLELLGFCTLIAVMLVLIFVQDAGMARISGTMGFMAAAAWRALPVANRLVDAVANVRGALPYLRKAAELIRMEQALAGELLPLSTLPAAPADETPLAFNEHIALEGVTFRYPRATAALEAVSLRISAGSMVGIVGLSGAGKSTLVNILTGLLPPESGRMLVDGIALGRENSSAWLGKIGYVAQAPYILDATLAENVALSRWGEALDRERVLECCRMAALDFVADLEKGIDTVLGDRGTRLSGGQAQRVAIARALYSEPELIIFDEATSSLDMKNEKAIHDTILSLRNKVTLVVIAHRLTTVQGCDALIWLENSHVRRQGAVADVLPEYEATLRDASRLAEPL